MNIEIVELLGLLRALGLATTGDFVLPGESPKSARLRQLEVLQIYSRTWEKPRLERLAPHELAHAEAQILEQAAKTIRDWQACIALLYRAGHRLTLISEITGVPIETLHDWYPFAPPDAAAPMLVPASQTRN